MADTEKITLKLTMEQRELLLSYRDKIDDDSISPLICVGLKEDNRYLIYLDENQIYNLSDLINDLADEETDSDLQEQLDDLADYIMDYLIDEDVEFEYSKQVGDVYNIKIALYYDKNIWRKIEIRGGHTLNDLHNIIFDAFEREDEHLYSFYLPSKAIHSRNISAIVKSSTEYTHPYNMEESWGNPNIIHNAADTTLSSIAFTLKQKLFYLFDFGDEWWHEITLEKIDKDKKKASIPKVLEKHGDSPPQF